MTLGSIPISFAWTEPGRGPMCAVTDAKPRVHVVPLHKYLFSAQDRDDADAIDYAEQIFAVRFRDNLTRAMRGTN